jgi:hypothetical protein
MVSVNEILSRVNGGAFLENVFGAESQAAAQLSTGQARCASAGELGAVTWLVAQGSACDREKADNSG